MRNKAGAVASGALAILLALLLWTADARMPNDAEFSGLYERTLKHAYSRFRERDERVPARSVDPVDLGFVDPIVGPNQPDTGIAMGTTPAPRSRRSSPLPALEGRFESGSSRGEPHRHHGPYINEGNVHATAGDLDRALAAFHREIDTHPDCALAHHRIADVLQQQGKSDSAIAEYREVLRIQPDYFCAHIHIGDLLLARGESSPAEEAFARAVAGYGGQIAGGGVPGTVAAYHLADFYLGHDRELEEAVRLAETVAASEPPQPTYYFLLARSYEGVGRDADAAVALARAAELNPEQRAFYERYRRRLGEDAVGNPENDG